MGHNKVEMSKTKRPLEFLPPISESNPDHPSDATHESRPLRLKQEREGKSLVQNLRRKLRALISHQSPLALASPL